MFRSPKTTALIALLMLGGLFLSIFVTAPNTKKTKIPDRLGALTGDRDRGEYLVRAAGCVACHTDIENGGEYLAGGPPIVTQFGTFYAPNITPDRHYGIGEWSLEDFYNSIITGVSPSGQHYFPVFPYTSYVGIVGQDIVDLKLYLDSVTPIAKPSTPHKLVWPFNYRELLGIWKLAFFDPPRSGDASAGGERLNRGAYLVMRLGHCGECHSQRNLLGGINKRKPLRGNSRGPDGFSVPAISGPASSIESWDVSDLSFYLQTGVKADGDVVGGAMSEVVYESTSYLTDDDLDAIANYLLSNEE